MRWILTGLAVVAGLMGGLAVLWAATAGEGTPAASHGGHLAVSPAAGTTYAGRYDPASAIRSLTPEEIAQIERGEGAGFALPAELNGVPGPRHVLDLAHELGLSHQQETRVQAVYDQMRAAVIPAGRLYLDALQAVEEDFRTGMVTEAGLPDRVAKVKHAEAELVAAHLVAHLKTAEILTPDQISAYNRLRGYELDTPLPGTPAP